MDDDVQREVMRHALLDLGWVLVGWDRAEFAWVFQYQDGTRRPIVAETLPEAMRILLAQIGD